MPERWYSVRRNQSKRKDQGCPEQRLPWRIPVGSHCVDLLWQRFGFVRPLPASLGEAQKWSCRAGGASRPDLEQMVGSKRKDEWSPGTWFLAPGPSGNPPVFQEELGDVKAVSAPAASPIRCETSRERDRTSVLPRCDSRPPGGGRYPLPELPDRTKHIGRGALRVPPASG